MGKYDPYKVQEVKMSSAAALEAVGRVLIDSKKFRGTVTDFSRIILRAIGFKIP